MAYFNDDRCCFPANMVIDVAMATKVPRALTLSPKRALNHNGVRSQRRISSSAVAGNSLWRSPSNGRLYVLFQVAQTDFMM